MPRVPLWHTCLKCPRALRPPVLYVLTCLTCLRVFMPLVRAFPFYVLYVPSFITCLTCLHFLCALHTFIFYVPSLFTCLHSLHVLRVFIVLRAFIFLRAYILFIHMLIKLTFNWTYLWTIIELTEVTYDRLPLFLFNSLSIKLVSYSA